MPFEGNRQVARPFPPIILGAFEELTAGFVDRRGQAFIGAQQQGERLFQNKGNFVEHERNRRVGGATQGQIGGHVTDMVGAARPLRPCGVVGMSGAKADADARVADDGSDQADYHHRPEHPLEFLETWGEVGDFERRAIVVEKSGRQDGGIVLIILFRAGEVFDLNVEEADFGIRLATVVEKIGKNRIAVKAGKTGPDHPSALVDEGAECGVANDANVEVVHVSKIKRFSQRLDRGKRVLAGPAIRP